MGIVDHTADSYISQRDLIVEEDLIIFDVGAHHGETCETYRNLFPASRIYSFEPDGNSFAFLIEHVKDMQNVSCYNLALGKTTGKIAFNRNKDSGTSSLLPINDAGSHLWGMRTDERITVDITTLDSFVVGEQIDHIDILKMDTQGTEYDILEGACNSLRDDKISMIYLEMFVMSEPSTYSAYVGHKHIDETMKLLRENGFSLYNIYNHIYTHYRRLCQIDAIFIHENFFKSLYKRYPM